MSVDTLSSHYCVDFQSTEETDFAIKENEFTAGFAERNQDGINNIRRTWRVSFSQMPYSEMAEVWDFLRSRKGYQAFLWVPPRESVARKWTCTQLKRNMDSFNSWNIEANFQEQFHAHANGYNARAVPSVHATGYIGTITPERISSGGNQPVDGVSATGIAATVHPVQFIEPEFHSAERQVGWRFAHFASDDYLYIFSGYRFIHKIDPVTMKQVDVLDCVGANGITGVSHRWYWYAEPDDHPYRRVFITDDGTYLYFGPFKGSEQNGMYYRVSLSDFRSATRVIAGLRDIDGLGVPEGDFQKGGGGGLFVYGGYLWLLPFMESNTWTPYITRISLSDFTYTTGMSTLDLTPFQVTGDYLSKVQGYCVHDHYVTMVMGHDDDRAVRFDLNNFTTGGIETLDISDVSNKHRTLCGRGAEYDGWIYFANHNWPHLWRINTAHTAFEVFDYGLAKGGNETARSDVRGVGVVIDQSTGIAYITGAFDAMMVKIDLTSNGGTFSDLTVEFINIQDYALGDDPFNVRRDDGSFDLVMDDQWVYYLARSFQGNKNIPVMRVHLKQGQFNVWPPRLYIPADREIAEYDWAGGDLAPDVITVTTYPYALFEPVSTAAYEKYVIAIGVRFQGGGAGVINTLTLSGIAATEIVGNSNGNSYAGIWLIDPQADGSGLDLVITASDPIYYFGAQIYKVVGMLNGTPTFVGTPISGTGKEATFTYDVEGKGVTFGMIACDFGPTDWSFNFTAGDDPTNWQWDNYDYWGPEPDFGDATNFTIQLSYVNPSTTPVVGASITFSWDSPPDTEDLPFVGVMMSMSFDPIPNLAEQSKVLKGVEAIGRVYSQFPAEESWLNAGPRFSNIPVGGYD